MNRSTEQRMADAAHLQADCPDRFCRLCGKKLVRRRYSAGWWKKDGRLATELERKCQFMKRVFCGPECYAQDRKDNPVKLRGNRYENA